jgi:ribosomal protein L2
VVTSRDIVSLILNVQRKEFLRQLKSIEYDPNRTAFALLAYADGENVCYCSKWIESWSEIGFWSRISTRLVILCLLNSVRTVISCIQLRPGQGAVMLVLLEHLLNNGKDGKYATIKCLQVKQD